MSATDPLLDEAQTQQLRGLMPFADLLGFEALRAPDGEVRARIAWRDALCTTAGVMHGGALMSLADTVGAVCAFNHLPEGATGTTTIESKTNFFRALREGHVTASAKALHAGRTTVVVETELRDDAGKLVAKVTQTQAVLRG